MYEAFAGAIHIMRNNKPHWVGFYANRLLGYFVYADPLPREASVLKKESNNAFNNWKYEKQKNYSRFYLIIIFLENFVKKKNLKILIRKQQLGKIYHLNLNILFKEIA